MKKEELKIFGIYVLGFMMSVFVIYYYWLYVLFNEFRYDSDGTSFTFWGIILPGFFFIRTFLYIIKELKERIKFQYYHGVVIFLLGLFAGGIYFSFWLPYPI